MTRRPTVGITAAVEEVGYGPWKDVPAALAPMSYARSVLRAGGRPVLLVPNPEDAEDPASVLGLLDALIISGGAGDLDPTLYGQERHPETGPVNPERDAYELALATEAAEKGVPTLGVCRGIEVINVAYGGTLEQHLPDAVGHERHRTRGTFVDHDVRMSEGSLAARATGSDLEAVKSCHHQGIRDVADGLRATGWATMDEAVEAVEDPELSFMLGVLWHPEEDEKSRLISSLLESRESGVANSVFSTRDSRERSDQIGDTMLEILNPATEEVIERLEQASVEDADAAVARARAAFPKWKSVEPADRAKMLRRLAEALDSERENLAQLESRNTGKPINDARGEMGMVAETFHYYAGMPERLLGDTIPVSGGIDMTFREPLGVVALIVPWNFPLTIASWKMAPALAAGNTLVLKPAELTPLTAVEFEKISLEAGIPEGVVNVVVGPGSSVGQRLAEHPDVAKVAFTGSTDVGRKVMEAASATIKRVTLELGGKSANIVFADSDLERAAVSAPSGVFGNAGQDCCARSRILVQKSALDDFMSLFESAVKNVRVGDPQSADTEMGPLISAPHREKVSSFVPDDAPVAFRGDAPHGSGFWFAPTVLAPVANGDRAAREEIFGPVAAVIPFEDEADAIHLANDTIYGLSGSVWTRDGAKALRVARAVDTGVIAINSNTSVRVATPFGGVKQSGVGRELGPHALDHYTEVKNVYFAL